MSDRFDDSDFEDNEEFVPPSEEELKAMEARRKKSDQISAELGRRMMQGWGLMGTTCPNDGCFNPLMKEPKTARLFCVNCNMYAITEAEYEAMKANAPVASAPTAPAPSDAAQPSVTTPTTASSHATTSSALSNASSAHQAAAKASDVTPSSLGFPSSSLDSIALPPAPKPSESVPAAAQPPQRPVPEAQAAFFERSRNAALKTIEVITERMELLNLELGKCGANWEYATRVLAQQEQCANALVTVRNACVAMNFL